MGRRSQIAIVVSLVLLLIGAGSVYAWDAAKKDQIAEGVTIGGVDVGGRTTEEAAALVEADLVEPLDRPVTVTYKERHFTLEPDELDVRADRGRAKALSFGAGPHFCLGANLARAELQEAFDFLAPRMRALALDGEPVYDTPLGVYGLRELPIRFSAAA